MKRFLQLFILSGIGMLAACGGGSENTPAEKPQSMVTKTEATGDAQKGKSLYMTCSTCHGQNGEGMVALGAPALAGQEAYYLKRQLNNFRTNKRGSHEKDAYGAQMQPMAKILDSQGIEDVTAYILTLPVAKNDATIEGNVENGHNYYNMICGACHGPGAKGIESLGSPKLTGLQDWYIQRQLNNFRDSIRGTTAKDSLGAQMLTIAAGIPDDQTVKDLATYIHSLQAE